MAKTSATVEVEGGSSNDIDGKTCERNNSSLRKQKDKKVPESSSFTKKSKRKKCSNHRKQKRPRHCSNGEKNLNKGRNASCKSVTNVKRKCMPLNGLTLAVSTLDGGEKHVDAESSYSSVSAECTTAGATVTGQVHKRVYAVICNRSAVEQSTQRVRKALKRKIPLVDVSWVRHCVSAGVRVGHKEFLLNELGLQVANSKKIADGEGEGNLTEGGSRVDWDPNNGWSEPAVLGCCCVCHENGDRDCPWCAECGVKMVKGTN